MQHQISINENDTILIAYTDGTFSAEISAADLKQKLNLTVRSRSEGETTTAPDAKNEKSTSTKKK